MNKNHSKDCALLIVDMQNAYFNNGALKENQTALTYNINALIALARAHSLPVFNIRTEHQKDVATWTLNMINDKQGYLFAGDKDNQCVPNLTVDDSIEVVKTRDSAFYGTTLCTMLKNHQVDNVIICGVSTHTCVFQTASDAYAANLNVIIAKDATASHQPQYHQTALDILHIEYRQAAMTNSELKQYIQDNRQ